MILNVFLAFLLKTFAVSVAVSASFFILENGENSDERFSVTEGLLACDRDKSCEQVQYNIDTKDFKLVDNVDVAAKTAKTNGISWTKVQGAYKSCKDALPLHINESEYRIKHINMFSPAIVRCKRNEGRITASFDHNSEDRIKLNGFEAPGSYRHEIKYKSKLEDIIAFVDSSYACKQFTRIDCYHMQITDVGYLIDRRGNQMAYIGGGPVKGHGKYLAYYLFKCAVQLR
ncbi:uncharacterized protein LOC135688568 isoform X2 [Rhopilema esculentum]|uniref:uncharacterized protein LOC135688568 isoform X2 n=1 Tax=Rhopilema esculentum TaxID=499914 RepID=UPI0031CE2796